MKVKKNLAIIFFGFFYKKNKENHSFMALSKGKEKKNGERYKKAFGFLFAVKKKLKILL